MKMVYTAADPVLVGHLRAVLDAEQIRTLLKNDFLTGGIGELPAAECWPELWVIDPADHARGQALVDAFTSDQGRLAESAEPWRCPRCGELLEPQFTDCWRCNSDALPA